jgi:hypothetical protein
MPKRTSKTGSDLFIVDNSDEERFEAKPMKDLGGSRLQEQPDPSRRGATKVPQDDGAEATRSFGRDTAKHPQDDGNIYASKQPQDDGKVLGGWPVYPRLTEFVGKVSSLEIEKVSYTPASARDSQVPCRPHGSAARLPRGHDGIGLGWGHDPDSKRRIGSCPPKTRFHIRSGAPAAIHHPEEGDPIAPGRRSYQTGTVWLDKAQSAGFRGVPEEVWEFHIGGHQVCEKWLKARKGRRLTADDVLHYNKIVTALSNTIHIMKEIDKVIDKHGGWPGAFVRGES